MPMKHFLYKELYADLRLKISDGRYAPGQRMPSEDALAEEYHMSKITIKRALELLRGDGLIKRVQGKGTFVADVGDVPAPSPRPAGRGEKLIGLVLEHVSSTFGLNMMYHIIQLLDKAGYKACIRFSFGSIEKETEEINALLRLNIAGLIIMPCHDSYYNMTILKLILDHFPVVLVDKQMHGLPVSCVCTDGSGAVRALMARVRAAGAENAALITIDPSSASSLGDRTEGFYKGLEENGLQNAGELILPRRTGNMISNEPEYEYVSRIGDFLDGMEALPQAVVCTEYAIGRALYIAAARRELVLGRDFRACCIDENPETTTGPFLTHMHQDEFGIADGVVEVILGLLKDSGAPQRLIRVPAIYVEGHTL